MSLVLTWFWFSSVNLWKQTPVRNALLQILMKYAQKTSCIYCYCTYVLMVYRPSGNRSWKKLGAFWRRLWSSTGVHSAWRTRTKRKSANTLLTTEVIRNNERHKRDHLHLISCNVLKITALIGLIEFFEVEINLFCVLFNQDSSL